ncbi:hypothetical protein [Halomicronema sp. CCY15110]|uniref:hypothetical protein n=1 Tax=Halomicronema sp. CCY15110 TaxID=2767773 RepID=UPI00194FB473|nr:hypothetical protein [Halomicronema sp. CCY15110]
MMRILSISLALGMSSFGLLSAPPAPASQMRLRDCPGMTWEAQSGGCKVVDFHAPPPDVEAFEVSLRQSLPVAIAQYRTDFAIAHAPPQQVGLLALQYEVTPSPTWLSMSVQMNQVP